MMVEPHCPLYLRKLVPSFDAGKTTLQSREAAGGANSLFVDRVPCFAEFFP